MANMQVLPVANLVYLCPSLWWAEYELYRRKKEKVTEECKMWNSCTCSQESLIYFWALIALPILFAKMSLKYHQVVKSANLLVSMAVKASFEMLGPEPLIVFALK